MAIYMCEGCDSYVDGDWHPMSEDELCPDCQMEKDEAKEEANESSMD